MEENISLIFIVQSTCIIKNEILLEAHNNIISSLLSIGTAGNTGIGLAHMCMALGYKCVVYIPDDQTKEKIDMLKGYLYFFIPRLGYAIE